MRELAEQVFTNIISPAFGYMLFVGLLLSPIYFLKQSFFPISPITITVIFLASILSTLVTVRDTPACTCMIFNLPIIDYFHRGFASALEGFLIPAGTIIIIGIGISLIFDLKLGAWGAGSLFKIAGKDLIIGLVTYWAFNYLLESVICPMIC